MASAVLMVISIVPLSGCAEKPAETQISSLTDFENFFMQYPSTGFTYVALTPAGEAQVIEAATDSNGDGKWQDSDKPIAARAATSATKVTIIENSIQLQVFYSFYGDGSGFSLESNPVNVNDIDALAALGEGRAIFLAVHPTSRPGNLSPYESGDGPAVGYAYVEPAAVASYLADLRSVK
ncbi:MAG: hypothetical protein RLZ28_482 [Actinomycetota bacterium]